MTEADLFQQARIYLPKYLSPEKQRDLWEELKSFPNNRSYYSTEAILAEQLLQGDGWRGFVVIDFHTLEKKVVSGVVMSNSCDIGAENPRALAPNVLFAPLIRLDAYCRLLRGAGQTETQIQSVCESIRKQRFTTIFYLPSHGDVLQESIVVLYDIHGHPLLDFTATDRSYLFRLNQFAFYLFLMKISIHFTRMQEGVAR